MSEAAAGKPFTLWHRPTRRHKWQAVGSAATSAEALALMEGSGHRNGHWIVATYDPNEKTPSEAAS